MASIASFWFRNAAAAPTTSCERGDRVFLVGRTRRLVQKVTQRRKVTEGSNVRKSWIFNNFMFFDFLILGEISLFHIL